MVAGFVTPAAMAQGAINCTEMVDAASGKHFRLRGLIPCNGNWHGYVSLFSRAGGCSRFIGSGFHRTILP
jgi:hypothetical protein